MINSPKAWRAGATLYFLKKGKPHFLLFERDKKCENWPGALMFGWGGQVRESEKRLVENKDPGVIALMREKREEIGKLLPKKDLIGAPWPIVSILHGDEPTKRSVGTGYLVRISEEAANRIVKNSGLLRELVNPKIVTLGYLEKIHSSKPEKFQPHYLQLFSIIRDYFASRRASRT